MFVMPMSAQAGWKYVTSSNQSDTYIDTDTIKKRGGDHYVWLLKDHFKPIMGPNNSTIWSDMYYAQFNCREGKSRWLDSSIHFKPMAKDIGRSAKAHDRWTYHRPGTVLLAVAKEVCKY